MTKISHPHPAHKSQLTIFSYFCIKFFRGMKNVLLIYVVLIAGIITWYFTAGKAKKIIGEPKATALKVSKHSTEFNLSLQEAMDNYYKMINDFVKGDTSAINKEALKLKKSLEDLKIQELQKDSAIYETAASIWDNTKTEIAGILTDPSVQAKREALNLFSNELFTLLLTIHYDLAKLYWQECPSAFGEDTPGNWLSESELSKNPYGKDNCATVKKVIDFAPPDSTKK